MQLSPSLGILCGFCAATFQAGSYIFSRRFLTECRPSSRLLFALSHLQMGVVALVMLPLVLDGPLPPVRSFALQLGGTSGFYLTAQWLLFVALKRTDSSVIAPLLGLKIPLLGVIGALLLSQSISGWGWLAIGLCTLAAFVVSPPRGLPAVQTLGLILLICLLYCGSDIFIPQLIERVSSASDHPILLAVSLTYIVCGVCGLLVALHQGAFKVKGGQRYALPYSFCWFAGMCFLFATFSAVGIIFGNMLQSTRSLIAVLLGLLVSRIGLTHIETSLTAKAWMFRLAGALLMTLGIVLYYARMASALLL